MAINANTSEVHGLVDVIPPLAPPDYTLWWIGGVFSVVILILIGALIWRRYLSRRGRARSALRRCKRSLLAGSITDQDAAYAIAAALQSGLGLNEVTASMLIPDKIIRKEATWLFFLKQLAQLRYVREVPSIDMASLFRQADRWLRIWP